MTSENPDVIEHQNVPVEHRSLHDFLYSAADEHAADPTADLTAARTDDNWSDLIRDQTQQTQAVDD